MLFLNLSALRRHLPSYTSAFKLSLFANVRDDGKSAIKSRCICSFVPLVGGKRRSSKACSSQILKFAQVRVASGFAFLGVRRVAIKWLLVEQELCITSIQLETKWNWEFADTTRENLRVEWIQVIMTISRSNGLDLNGQRYWADSLVPGNCQDVKTSGMSQDGMCPQKIVILPWFPMIFRFFLDTIPSTILFGLFFLDLFKASAIQALFPFCVCFALRLLDCVQLLFMSPHPVTLKDIEISTSTTYLTWHEPLYLWHLTWCGSL